MIEDDRETLRRELERVERIAVRMWFLEKPTDCYIKHLIGLSLVKGHSALKTTHPTLIKSAVEELVEYKEDYNVSEGHKE